MIAFVGDTSKTAEVVTITRVWTFDGPEGHSLIHDSAAGADILHSLASTPSVTRTGHRDTQAIGAGAGAGIFRPMPFAANELINSRRGEDL